MIAWLVATGGGIGALPRAQGTAASLVAVALVWAIDGALSPPWWWTLPLAGAAAIANLLTGRWIARQFGAKDPGAVVIDEFAGQWLALSFPGRTEGWLLGYAAPFLLFRLFDISKILGVRALEKLPGAAGILCDDLLAGGYALAVLYLLQRFL